MKCFPWPRLPECFTETFTHRASFAGSGGGLTDWLNERNYNYRYNDALCLHGVRTVFTTIIVVYGCHLALSHSCFVLLYPFNRDAVIMNEIIVHDKQWMAKHQRNACGQHFCNGGNLIFASLTLAFLYGKQIAFCTELQGIIVQFVWLTVSHRRSCKQRYLLEAANYCLISHTSRKVCLSVWHFIEGYRYPPIYQTILNRNQTKEYSTALLASQPVGDNESLISRTWIRAVGFFVVVVAESPDSVSQ